MKRVITFSALGLVMMAGLGAALLTVGIEPGLAARLTLLNNFPL